MGPTSTSHARRRARTGLALAAASVLAGGPARGQAEGDAGLMEAVVAAAAPLIAELDRKSPRFVEVRDGWLAKSSLQVFRFLNPEPFGAAVGPTERRLDTVVGTITNARDQLEELGIELLVVPLPTRLALYPEVLCDVEPGPAFAGLAPGTGRFVARLRDAGVEVLDVLPALAAERGAWDGSDDELVFLRANAHWSPKGMAVAADAIAEAVRERAWYEPPAAADTRIERVRERWEPGDEQLPDGVEPPVLELERVVDLEGGPVARTDRDAPVVLWGDSFTQIYDGQQADLARHLRHRLGRPLDVFASLGGGPDASRKSFARRREGLEEKRLVIWVFANRAVMTGSWSQVRLHMR